MASEPDLSSGATEDRAAVRRELIDELRELDERLRTMVDEYEAKPSAFDISLKATGTAVDIETAITEVYRIMKTRVYAEDSPLRVESDIWEPFDDQKDEFFDSYKSAVMALETYKEVFETYEF